MSRFKPRTPSPALAVATLALVIAMGGTSYAAFNMPKNSVGTKQLKNQAVTPPKVAPATIALFKGEKGDKGDPGPQGIQGSQGAKGDQGPPGPSSIRFVDNSGGFIGPFAGGGTSGTILTLHNVAPGSYIFRGWVNILPGAATATACGVSGGGSSDLSRNYAPAGGEYTENMIEGAWKITTTTDVVLQCAAFANQTWQVEYAYLSATQVGSVATG